MNYQSGQSTLLMLVMSLILMLTIVFIFNTSQLLSERQQAKMLADQSAYATATRQARLLNLNAYINRTQIANQLAIAQGVSTASWSKYAAQTSTNISRATSWFPPVSAVFSNIGTGLNYFADSLGIYIKGYGIEVKALELAQDSLNLASNATILNAPKEFGNLAKANSSDYDIRLIASASKFPAQIIKQYTAQERQRMADVVLSSADPFITNRSKNDIFPKLVLAPGGWNEYRIHKAGGTELVQLDEWKGIDTLSIHHYYKTIRRFKIRKKHDEIPIGWGSALGSQLGQDKASKSGSYGGASSTNPKSRRYAEKNTPQWDVRNYGGAITGAGIPKFYELRDLNNKDNIFPLVVSVKKSRNKLVTSNRNSNLSIGKDFTVLDNYDALEKGGLSNGDMQAITQAEVYFQRPWQLEVSGNQINHEYGSLFSPYWKTRLSDDMDVAKRTLVNTESALVN
ncbi:Tad domain-containing protein [Acinetobacter sp. AG3]|uniref:Tad domain-containing protein n=2 Tax=unclassified Acinetobacter TaxID=196816 RepID=UPI001EF06C5A|nr:Tad domain-containing protein [Acinetobacter sp. AG3]MCG7220157.1 Tad domain-containing protein [Acinetobacter sp. AG3]